MIALLTYTIAAFGLAYIAGFSKISLPLRKFLAYYADWPHTPRLIRWPTGFALALIECPACLGFWIGLVYGLYEGRSVEGVALSALFTTGSNFILGRLTGLIREESNG